MIVTLEKIMTTINMHRDNGTSTTRRTHHHSCRLSIDKLKIFVSAIACITKFGKEVSIELNTQGLVLRTLNDSLSASGEFIFPKDFFDQFSIVSKDDDEEEETEVLFKSKMFVKTLQSIFRSLRNVLSGELYLSQDNAEMTVVLLCLNSIRKTHRIQVSDGQILRALFDRSTAMNVVKLRTHHFMTLVGHIYNTNEIRIVANASSFRLSSYYPGSEASSSSSESLHRHYTGHQHHLQTETIVQGSDFTHYRFQSPVAVELIFCLKEIKALLGFCETTNADEIAMYFIDGGKYVVETSVS